MEGQLGSNIIKDILRIDSRNDYETGLVQQCFDMVNVFVAAVDVDGNITFINRKGLELLGLEEESIVGQNFITRFVQKDQQSEKEALFNSVQNSQSAYSENTRYRLRTNNNKIILISAKNIPIRDKQNNVLGILISGEDVTRYVRSQRELQNNLNLYSILAQNIPDINVYLFDEDQRFIIAEGSEMKNNGFESSDFEDKRLAEIKNKALIKIWEPFFEAAIAGKEVSSEYKFNNYYYLIWVIPVKDSDHKTNSGIAITQNITDEKRSEQRLKQAKEMAETANRAKSDFLARISHEIRTPLNGILGFTEQLKQTQLDSKQDEYVKIIDKSSEHLLSLINDILILSKIEAGQIVFEKSAFKIAHTVKYAHNLLLAKAEDKGLIFSHNVDAILDMVVLGDSFRLRQILINMLSNAIKFTDSGYVELRCFLVEDSKNQVKVRFDIIDTGIGINSDNLQSIFEQFKQADSSIAQKYGGTGLGLTICKNLIEMQGGGLSVSSQENIGTTFSFVIPYTKGKESDIVSKHVDDIDPDKLRNKKVLLVDDDTVNVLLGKAILEKMECDFDIANNGKEAIEKLDAKQYDIVLLDIQMADISGIDVAKYFRQKKNNGFTKIVAVTAAVMKDDINKYYEAGINDFLVKPFKEIHLFNKMCEVLQLKNRVSSKSAAEIILKEEIHPKPYDLSELKKMSENNPEMISNMLTTFIENSELALQKFQKALINENWSEIAEASHKILPSYRHLKVNRIISMLDELKNSTLNSPNSAAIVEKTNKVEQSIVKLLEELRKELQKLNIEK